MKTAEKILTTAATTVGKRLGDIGVEALGLVSSSGPRVGVLAGLDMAGETATSPAPSTVQRPATLTQVDPWGLVMKWGGPALTVALGLVALRAAWSWAGSFGKCRA